MGLFSKPEVIGPGGTNDADRSRIAGLEQRVARLEAQLAQLTAAPAGTVAAAAVAATEDWTAEVRRLVADDKLIHAIKLYREKTGCGLREAKEAVEAMQR
ncbi:hypothetical protein SAMN04489844_0276 [Nocardioides exalbidus]|uniref:Ribosomal protein L7/L12 C-terminal domain-containing protein n=1 Tax=Nocardioides exalbidus TaxID=402596 RepID=A0A1H4JS99_9ACTN|nr:hypothetical protein [Nocardioides exalbidus]SEB49170.1 hypothetical protein SAMN04489844_0276 [Nocardioides exalbidus]